jgi:hypothetical protein
MQLKLKSENIPLNRIEIFGNFLKDVMKEFDLNLNM